MYHENNTPRSSEISYLVRQLEEAVIRLGLQWHLDKPLKAAQRNGHHGGVSRPKKLEQNGKEGIEPGTVLGVCLVDAGPLEQEVEQVQAKLLDHVLTISQYG